MDDGKIKSREQLWTTFVRAFVKNDRTDGDIASAAFMMTALRNVGGLNVCCSSQWKIF